MPDVRDAPQVDTPLVQPITEERTWTPASQPYACQDSQKMATRMTSSRFVGRTAELTELRALLGDASESRPSLAFIGGESGVGKSRLADELKRHARESGARVLSGDCVELGEDELPYAPLLSALRPLVREGDPALDALAPPLRSALDAILPGLGTDASAGEAAQSRVFEALMGLLSCSRRPRPSCSWWRTSTGRTAPRAPSSASSRTRSAPSACSSWAPTARTSFTAGIRSGRSWRSSAATRMPASSSCRASRR